MSSRNGCAIDMRRAAPLTRSDHRVADREQFPHARDERERLRLTDREQALVERSDHDVAFRCDEGRYSSADYRVHFEWFVSFRSYGSFDSFLSPLWPAWRRLGLDRLTDC
jgi:hypothetical protein